MNHILDNPKGADRVAQIIQNRIFNNIGWSNIDVYGITEKSFDKLGSPVLEAYAGSGENKDVLFNDNRNASIFMIDDVEHKSRDGVRFSTILKVVFMIDLEKLFPDALHRAKQEAQLQAIKILRETPNFKFRGLEKGVRASLENFFYNDLIIFDLHPYHTFSISGEINYTVSCLID